MGRLASIPITNPRTPLSATVALLIPYLREDPQLTNVQLRARLRGEAKNIIEGAARARKQLHLEEGIVFPRKGRRAQVNGGRKSKAPLFQLDGPDGEPITPAPSETHPRTLLHPAPSIQEAIDYLGSVCRAHGQTLIRVSITQDFYPTKNKE